MARTILCIKPTPKTVPLHAANPDRCAQDLAAEFTLVPFNGQPTAFEEGDDWSIFAPLLANCGIRFQFSRNPPATNATETVGKEYRMTCFGFSSAKYDVRYVPGVLTVVAA